MSFDEFMNDNLTLIQNGQIFKYKIKGSVQGNTVFILDSTLPFEKNDVLLRELPNGLQESYIIDNPEFLSGGELSHFKIQVHKTDQPPDTKAHIVQWITNNISGNENIINIDSPGSIFLKNTELFSNLKIKIENEVKPNEDRALLLKLIDQLSKSKTKDEYKSNFDELIQKGANYMTIIAPFIPQLSFLLA